MVESVLLYRRPAPLKKDPFLGWPSLPGQGLCWSVISVESFTGETDRQRDRVTVRQTDRHIGILTDRHIDRQIYRQTDRHIGILTDRHIDRQIYRQIDRQTDIQRNRHTDRHMDRKIDK